MLVTATQPPTDGPSLAVFQPGPRRGSDRAPVSVLFPSDPRVHVRRAAHGLFVEMVSALYDTAAALESRDEKRAEAALLRARSVDARIEDFVQTVGGARETVRLAPLRRRSRGTLERYARPGRQDGPGRAQHARARPRVMSRLRRPEPVPAALPEAIRDLARAVEALAEDLDRDGFEAREYALSAAARATALLEEHGDLQTSVLVGAVRAPGVDVLRAAPAGAGG